MGAGRILLLVLAGLLALFGAGVVAGGAVLTSFGVHGDYVTSGEGRAASPATALVSEEMDVELGGVPSWVRDRLGTVRIRARSTDGGPAPFLGVARSDDVRRYLRGVPAATIEDVGFDPLVVTLTEPAVLDGRRPPAPVTRPFWTATGTTDGGRSELTWEVAEGDWVAVVMHPGARPGVDVTGDVGVTVPLARTLGLWILAAGIGALVVAALIVLLVVRSQRQPGEPTGAPTVVSDA